MTAPIDPTTLAQLQAAQDAAHAAWAAIAADWWTFAAMTSSLGVSALIALVAIRGPERDRSTRDLEARTSRARIEARSATAGLRALSAARNLGKYIQKDLPNSRAKTLDLENIKRKLDVRHKVIEHFLGLELRDVELVEWLHEVDVLVKALREAIDPSNDQPTAVAAEVIEHRANRMVVVRKSLIAFQAEKVAKDRALQKDLEEIWRLRWLVEFWVKPTADRD